MSIFKAKRVNLLLFSLILIILDQASKTIAKILLSDNSILVLFPNILHLNLVRNYGAAFSLFSYSTNFLKVFSLFSSIVFLILIISNYHKNALIKFSYSFLIAGSIGNGIDRWIYGYVNDFIDFTVINFPIFNFADIYINIGIAILLINNIKAK